MCGLNVIARAYNSNKSFSQGDLALMCSTISHRGPDEANFALLNQNRLGLAHVRLSIIDPQSGQQPMFDLEGRVAIILNGEIYDHPKLRKDLESRGHKFKSHHSDTEVALKMYVEYGMDFIQHLNGEFAFVIWDDRIKKLISFRDRMGVKPLYYRYNSDGLIISSESKGILVLDEVTRAFSNRYITGPMLSVCPKDVAVFEGLSSLKPAHYMVFDPESNRLEEKSYWRPNYKTNYNLSFNEAKDQLEHLISESVKRRLVSDVPLCVYLSGGLDSAIVCSEASRHYNVKAFNISFSHSEFDEGPEAENIARHFGTDFEKMPCSMDIMAENLMNCLSATELHMANPSAIGKFLLSKLIQSQGYKVALTGEGSDELFAGYPYFKLEKLWRMSLSTDPKEQKSAKALFEKFKKIEKRSEGILWNRNKRWMKAPKLFNHHTFIAARAFEYSRKINQFLNVESLNLKSIDNPFDCLKESYGQDGLEQLHPLHASLSLSLGQLAGYVIPTLGDRVEMAHSIEGRTPFLDRDVVDFSMTLPPEFLIDINQLREKHILLETYKNRLPPFMFSQHKHPFFSPNWHKLSKTKVGGELFSEFLSDSKLKEVGVFNPAFIKKSRFLWNLLPADTGLAKRLDLLMGIVMSVQMMHEIFIKNKPRHQLDFKFSGSV